MKSLTQATLLLRSTTHSSYARHFLLPHSNPTQQFQRLKRAPSHSFSSSSSLEDEEVNRNAKVSVWWDLTNCPIPNGVNPLRVSQNITTAIRANGIKGPITITAFGNFNINAPNGDVNFKQIPISLQEDLIVSGVSLKHILSGGENNTDRSLLIDFAFWTSQNPPPAHLFLISGDKNFAYILHRLRMDDYNILLASKDPAPNILSSVASITWPWCQLASGGKFINEPPDDPSKSCYRHSENLLEDSISDMGPPTCMQAECSPDTVFDSKPRADPLATTNQTGEVSRSALVQASAPQYVDGGSKLRAVPKATKKKIHEVVNSYPEGVDSSVLRAELLRRKILPKDLYGYKKFSVFLKSLGSVLKLESADSRIFVHGIKQKVAEPVGLPEPFDDFPETNVARPLGQSKDTKLFDSKVIPIADSEAKDVDKSRNLPEVVIDRENVTTTGVDKKPSVTAYSPGKVDPSPVLPEENAVHSTEGHHGPMGQNNLSADVGVFRRMWRSVLGHNSDISNTESNYLTEVCSTGDSFDKEKLEENGVSGPSPSSYESIFNGEDSRKCEVPDKPSQKVGMFKKIVDWCRFWKPSTIPDSTSGNFGEEETQVNNKSESNKLFSDAAFWEELITFLHTKKGASLISQSMTREQMAQQLQKEGPSHLNTLALADINHLVDLLIFEKKWIEESITKVFPYKLIQSGPALSSPSTPCTSNDLSSVTTGNTSQSNLQRESVKRKDAPVEACSDNSNKKPCGKSKNEILEDCQKLVTEMFKERPKGFNISTFRPSFRRRYGYDLDYQKLGYQKLAAMLQTFQGVDIGFDFVLPSNMSSKVVIPYNVENDHTEKENDNDSMFLELGPVSETSKRNPSRPGINRGANGFSDDSDFSDLEGETPMKDGSDQKSPTTDGECYKTVLDSLNLWHGKGDICNEDRLNNRREVVGYPRIDLKPSSGIGFGLKKPRKTYSFVSDEAVDEKGKMAEEILKSLDKPSESSLQR